MMILSRASCTDVDRDEQVANLHIRTYFLIVHFLCRKHSLANQCETSANNIIVDQCYTNSVNFLQIDTLFINSYFISIYKNVS